MIDKSNLSIVTSPKLYLDSDYKTIDEEGLLSQKIFGPIKNYKCKCEKYNNKTMFAEKRCPVCNVLCTSNESRFKTFAKIVIPLIVYKNIKRSRNKIRNIIKQSKYIIDPTQSDLSLTTEQYLSFDLKKDTINVIKKYDKTNCIPIKITGIYSLYIAIYCCFKIFNNQEAFEIIRTCFDNEILVIPPAFRPVIINEENGYKKIRINEINEFYQQIIRISKYDWSVIGNKDLKSYYLNLVRDRMSNNIQDPIDDLDLKYYDEITSKYQYYINKIYTSIIESLSGKEGYIRKDFLGRTVDFSSRSHIAIDPSLKAYEIRIPKISFSTLWFIEYLRYLYIHKNYEMETLLNYVKISEVKTEINKLQFIDEFIDYFFNSGKIPREKRLVLINRQPTLWRYGIPAVEVVGISDGDVINVSPMILEPLNADFDGDTAAIFRIHDTSAQFELQEKAFFLNNIIYDHNDSFIQTIRLESQYSAYVILSPPANIDEYVEIQNLDQVQDDYNFSLNYNFPVKFNGKMITVGICLFNKWCGFDDIKIDKYVSNQQISKIIYENSTSNEDFHKRLSTLNQRLLWFISTHPDDILTINIDELVIDIDFIKNKLCKLPKNPFIGQHLYNGLCNRIYDNIPDTYKIKKLTKIKIRKNQLSRLIGTIGYIANDRNIIDSNPISQSILSGLDPDIFFRTAYGTRKGIVDKSKITPESGYLARSMVVNLSPISLDSDDCGVNRGINIKIQSSIHAKSLFNRWYFNPKIKALDLYKPENLDSEIGKQYIFRTPILCQNPDFKICKKCFGEYTNLKSEYVGVLSGQYISERLTQLSMRTFHTSGSCTLQTDNDVVNFIYNNLEDIVENNDNTTTIIFKAPIIEKDVAKKFINIEGFIDFRKNGKEVIYKNLFNVQNQDVGLIIKKLNSIMKESKSANDIISLYYDSINTILEVGNIYSSFIECIFANMFYSSDNNVLRYALINNPDAQPVLKYSIRTLHKNISKLLGLLYEPNEFSIMRYSDNSLNITKNQNTIFEKFWEGTY